MRHLVKNTRQVFFSFFSILEHDILLSPSLMVAQFCAQLGNACFLRGSSSGPHGNYEGPLRSGKSVVHPHIHSYHDYIHPQVFQKGRASPLPHLTVGMDPKGIVKNKIKYVILNITRLFVLYS